MRHLSGKPVLPFVVLASLTAALLACGGGLTLPTQGAPATTSAASVATPAPATSPSQPAVAPEPTPISSPATPPGALAVFKTPEEAVTALLEGVAQNDIQKISQACAIDEMSEKFNFESSTARLGAFLPYSSLSPTDYPFYVETNRMQQSALIFGQVKILTYSLLSSVDVADQPDIPNMDAARISSFVKDVDPKRLSSLTVTKTALSNKTVMSSAKYLQNAAQFAQVYGADESTERVVLFSFEQNDYVMGFTLLRYGENWKISSLASALAGTNGSGAAAKTTVEEFDRLYNSN